MPSTHFLIYVEPTLQKVVNSFSLFCAILTLFLVVGLGYFRPHIFNRVSLRFQGIIALIDIIRHLIYSFLILPKDPLCAFMGFSSVLIDHLYLFINLIIAINIHLLYFHNIPPQKEIEILLLVGAIMVAIVIDVIPFAFDFYGSDLFGVCFIKPSSERKQLFKTILFYFVPLTALLYCLIIFVAVFMFLKLRKSYIEMKIPNKTIFLFGEVIKAREFIEKLYFRMALYPISAFICLLPSIVCNVYFDIHQNVLDWMYVLTRTGVRLTGTLNFLALLFDPHFQIAVKDLRKNGWDFSRVDKKEHMNDIDLKTIKDFKVDEECYIEITGKENIRFEEFIKFV